MLVSSNKQSIVFFVFSNGVQKGVYVLWDLLNGLGHAILGNFV